MKDLNSLSKEELQDFFNSFDYVLCDVHGVLWNVLDVIPGATKSVASLQNLGKHFIVVSNNTTTTLDKYHQTFKSAGFAVDKDNIVTPIATIISYLSKINFSKEIFVLGTEALRASLQQAGFKLAQRLPLEVLDNFSPQVTEDDENVGAVIADMDININFSNLQKAATFLKRPEVLFIKGTADLRLNMGVDRTVMGAGIFSRILEEISGRKPISLAKPSSAMNDYVMEKYQIRDPKRVLFVGDSVPSDMGFATDFGYQKLLVLTGLTGKGDLSEWKFPETYKPDYYVDSFGSVDELIHLFIS